MKMRVPYIIVLMVVQCVLLVTPQVLAQENVLPDSAIAAINAVWHGEWTNPIGHVYSAEMHLTVSNNGTIQGEIDWTLQKSPRDYEQAKVGLKGIEFVSGKYDAANKLLVFSGYKKEDPDTILGLDQYRLLLAENEKVIGGITFDNGDWRGIFSLIRVDRGIDYR